MQIVTVDKKSLKKFAEFPEALYEADRKYIPLPRRNFVKLLKKILFEEKTHFALIAQDDEVLAHVICARNPQDVSTGRFGLFECVHDQSVCNAILNETVKRFKAMGVTRVEGSVFISDQYNNCGVLVSGFDAPAQPELTYNKTYYDKLLQVFGLSVLADEETCDRVYRTYFKEI